MRRFLVILLAVISMLLLGAVSFAQEKSDDTYVMNEKPDCSQQEGFSIATPNVEEVTNVDDENTFVLSSTGSGQCGDDNSNVSWTLDNNGTLTLSGKGSLEMFYHGESIFGDPIMTPWYSLREEIKKVIVGEGIVSLGQQAFYMCTNLESVELPESLKDIGNSTFEGSGLKNLILPDSLTTFDATSVSGSSIESISTKTTNAGLKIVNGAVLSRNGKSLFMGPLNGSGTFDIPNTVERVHEYAFLYSSLSGINIPKSVKAIEFRAFAGSAIESIDIPDSVTELGIGVCTQCRYLRYASVGKGVTVLDDTFSECDNLISCNLGTGIKTLDRTFAWCYGLKSIELPNGLKVIGDRSFYQCHELKSITIPDTVETVGEEAFYESGITSIVFPESVTSIGHHVVSENVNVVINNPDLQQNSDGSYTIQNTHKFSGTFDYTRAYQVLSIVNQERKKSGKPALKMNASLLESAMQRAAETAVFFSHTRPNGSDCFTANDLICGENIHMGTTTAAAAMNSWMNSSGHKANILDADYKTIGVGCFSYNGSYYWVQLFGDDNISASAPKPANRNTTVTIDIGDTSKGELQEISSYIDCSRSRGLVGSKIQLSLYMGDLKAQGGSVIWESSNNSVASVDSNGLITMKKLGTCKVTARSKQYVRATITLKCVSRLSIGEVDKITVKNAVYKGKGLKPAVTIYCDGRKLTKGKDYTLTYKNNVNVGFGRVKITGKGKFKGSVTEYFRIQPKGTKLSSLKKAKKSVVVKWKALSKKNRNQTTGFQIKYSLNKNFKKAKSKTIKGNSKNTVKIKKLKSGKTYYFKIRTYKSTSYGKVYSSWSKVKKVKVK